MGCVPQLGEQNEKRCICFMTKPPPPGEFPVEMRTPPAWELEKYNPALCRSLHVEGRDCGHEASLEQAFRLGGLVLTVQLPPHKVSPQPLWSGRGYRLAGVLGSEGLGYGVLGSGD